MANDIIEYLDSNFESKKLAKILLECFVDRCYDASCYAEWHHCVAICIFGSVEDGINYVCLRPGLHLKVHEALISFPPSYATISQALAYMLHASVKNSSKKLTQEEREEYLRQASSEEYQQVFTSSKASTTEASSKTLISALNPIQFYVQKLAF